MSSRTRVLWLAKGLGRGGAERLLADCARYRARDQYDIEVAYVLPWKDALRPELEKLDIRVHCLDGGRAWDPRWVLRLRRLVRKGRYDIVHTHMPIPAVAARLVLGRHRPVLVHTEHNVWPRYHWATRWANAATYGRNEAVIAVSHAVAGTVAVPRVPLTVIHHGVAAEDFQGPDSSRARARALLDLPASAFVVGTVGNFTPKKDQRTLLRAFAILLESQPDAQLVLVGTGPLERELQQLASALRIADSVRFTGMRDDVPHVLPAFDVFVLTSLQEGLPIALVEAFAAGIPAVATDAGGTGEVLTDGQEGLLVPPARPELVAEALERFAGDPRLRAEFSVKALERARGLDIAAAQQRIERVYEQALRRAS